MKLIWSYIFKKSAKASFSRLSKEEQERIIKKLDFYCSQENPLTFAKRLTGPKTGTFRFRIGDFRVIFDVDEEGRLIVVALIGKRKEVYFS